MIGALAAAIEDKPAVSQVSQHIVQNAKDVRQGHPDFVNCTIGLPPKWARDNVQDNPIPNMTKEDDHSDELRFAKQKPMSKKE